MEIAVKIKPTWRGDYRLEYDGKYITLFGRDAQYPDWFRPDPDAPIEYEEVVLVAVVREIRNASPKISRVDEDYIYIETGEVARCLHKNVSAEFMGGGFLRTCSDCGETLYG